MPTVESLIDNALDRSSVAATAAEKRELLNRLMAKLAHEIRNPLSSLDIHVQLLEEDLGKIPSLDRQQLEPRFDILYGELHRLKRVVENFLRLASPASIDLEWVEVPGLLRQICELLKPEAAARNITISFHVAEAVPLLLADRVRLTQVLVNLVINGVQAVGTNGRVEMQAECKGGALNICVRDTGPGIPAELLGSIFDPYFTTKPEGTGLGLWIAQQIISAHGGSIQARNAPEGGALFSVSIPQRSLTGGEGGVRES